MKFETEEAVMAETNKSEHAEVEHFGFFYKDTLSGLHGYLNRDELRLGPGWIVASIVWFKSEEKYVMLWRPKIPA